MTAGYAPGLVHEDYAFADYLGSEQRVRTVRLAAFGEEPASYRSACVALQPVPSDDPEVAARAVAHLRGLGAPRVITIGQRKARVWRLGAEIQPSVEEETGRAALGKLIRVQSDRWSPESMLRARGIGPVDSYQLDFSDIRLMEVIESEVHAKLDRLLREVMHECSELDPGTRRQFRDLVRFIFWLITAKVLIDRGHPAARGDLSDVGDALAVAGAHYGIEQTDSRSPELPARRPELAQLAWDRIRSAFLFQNLSLDALALIYEGTLVDPHTRERLGIHATPRSIAEMVVERLPIEELKGPREGILELCAGFAPFLLASIRRLRRQRATGVEAAVRHSDLVRRLHAVELDGFAVEMARLSLTLADYPNSNGWRIDQGDVFADKVVETAVEHAGVVFSNPPFERFTTAERQKYQPEANHKSTELVLRLLEGSTPQMLGLVLPSSFVRSPRGTERELRARLATLYGEIDTVDVPDRAFAHSSVESVLLVARAPRAKRAIRLQTTSAVRETGGRWGFGEWRTKSRPVEVVRQDGGLRVGELEDVWERLEQLPRLHSVAEVHRGVEYKRALAQARDELISERKQAGMRRGVASPEALAPYQVLETAYLCDREEEIRRGGGHAWEQQKVLMNAVRRSRGWWRLTAAIDRVGLLAYQNLLGIWTRDVNASPLELLAAVLNGPVANAWVHEHGGERRHVQASLAGSVPFPEKSLLNLPRIVSLVRQAEYDVEPEIWRRIDAEILRGYNLPPRLERRLLRFFDGEPRFGVEDFSYYPPDFESALPLHEVLELDESRTVGAVLPKVPVFNDPRVSDMFRQVAEAFDE